MGHPHDVVSNEADLASTRSAILMGSRSTLAQDDNVKQRQGQKARAAGLKPGATFTPKTHALQKARSMGHPRDVVRGQAESSHEERSFDSQRDPDGIALYARSG